MKHSNLQNRIRPGWNALITLLLLAGAMLIILPLLLVVIISFSSADSIAYVGYSFFLFFTMLFSGGLVPTYMVNTNLLHLYDSFWIFIFPSMVSAFNVIILRTFIKTTIPDSLFEAAKIDGASDFVVFTRIVLPLFKAGLATVALFSVVARWNDWFTGMLYIENPKLVPLQTMLTSIQQNLDFIKRNAELANTQEGQDLLKSLPSDSARMAIVVISTAPILLAYPFFQRYFVRGLTIGSVKG